MDGVGWWELVISEDLFSLLVSTLSCGDPWVSPVSVRPRSAAPFQGQLVNVLVMESAVSRGVVLPWGSVTQGRMLISETE